MSLNAPPIIDISAAFSDDKLEKEQLIDEIREACLNWGFFQIVNHGVSRGLTTNILSCAEELFNLPDEVKERYNKDQGGFHRGYERLRAQNFEKRGQGDLKEGFYFGRDLPVTDPNVVARKFGQGPNKYPIEVSNPSAFKTTIDTYHAAMTHLAEVIFALLAQSLDIDVDMDTSTNTTTTASLTPFTQNPIATLRLLHYPPQPPTVPDHERGAGAHTDFGALTILLQDHVGGLQVLSRSSSSSSSPSSPSSTQTWIDIAPNPAAFVVNLGNLMRRWTNDRYLSNLHRVINTSGRERYSVPFFFNGNPDFVVECLSSCIDPAQGVVPKYDPISVAEWMEERYADTYGGETGKGKGEMPELSAVEAARGMA